MEQQIQISMLGRFTIMVDGVDLVAQLSKSKKGLSLLQYLILQEGMPAVSYTHLTLPTKA